MNNLNNLNIFNNVNANYLEIQDISKLESIIIKDGLITPISFSVLNEFSQEQISLFCHKYAIYQLPILELIDFLKDKIGNSNAIEIGSGNGSIGRALGIKMTDNKMQEWDAIKAEYAAIKQPVITYGKDIELLDGISAIKKYNPEIVIATWVTHKWHEGMKSGNFWGVEEKELFENGVKKYIHIGNELTHKEKPILKKYKVEKHYPNWLISRSIQRAQNVIYEFTNELI